MDTSNSSTQGEKLQKEGLLAAKGERQLVRLASLLRLARYGFLAAGAAFLAWEIFEVIYAGEAFGLPAALEIVLISVIGPSAVWFATRWGEGQAAEARQRHRELAALNQVLRSLLDERTRLSAELVETQNHMELLRRVSSLVGQDIPLGQLTDRVLDQVLELMEMDAGELWLLNPFRGELNLISQRGLAPEAFFEKTRLRLGEGFPGLAAQTKEVVSTDNLAAETRFLRRSVVAAGFTHFSAVPLFSGDRVIGALTAASRRSRPRLGPELETLISLGRLVAPLFETMPRRFER